jgi:hypothetical protein
MKQHNAFLILPLIALFSLHANAAHTPKKGEISEEAAKTVALKTAPGKIKSSEYEFEKGQNVYSFDIAANDGKIHEVLVSANSGKVISATIESSAKEAAEAEADAKGEKESN